MKTIQNEKGIALVIVLVLSLITLAMTAAMIYMATQGTRFSGLQKSYKTALEANIGGVEALENMIILRDSAAVTAFETALAGIGANITTPVTCTGSDAFGVPYTSIMTKIRTPTRDETGAFQWTGCDSSLTIDSAVPATYDFIITLGTYNVYAKIVNTAEGNAVQDKALKESGVVQAKGAFVPHLGYLYTLEVLAELAANPRDRAKTSVLFEY